MGLSNMTSLQIYTGDLMTVEAPKTKQCKVPLDWQKPDINICILEKGHWDIDLNIPSPHETYGLKWKLITYI